MDIKADETLTLLALDEIKSGMQPVDMNGTLLLAWIVCHT